MSYGSPPPEGGQPPPGPGPSSQAKGFFGALFDFSFTSFATPSIVKIVYVLAMVFLVLGWLGISIVIMTDSVAGGLAALILGLIPLVVYLAFVRMTLEFYYSVVRMSEDVHRRLPQS